MITLGYQPYPIEVVLSRGGAFEQAIVGDDPWPSGASAELRFTATDTSTPIVWPGDVSDTEIAWERAPADVAAVLAAGATHVRLVYTDAAGEDLIWGTGRVRVA